MSKTRELTKIEERFVNLIEAFEGQLDAKSLTYSTVLRESAAKRIMNLEDKGVLKALAVRERKTTDGETVYEMFFSAIDFETFLHLSLATQAMHLDVHGVLHCPDGAKIQTSTRCVDGVVSN